VSSGGSFFVPTMSAVIVFVVTVIAAPALGLLRIRLPDWITWACFAAGVLAGFAAVTQRMSVLVPLSILGFSVIALVGWSKEEHWAGRYDARLLGRGALFHAYGLGAFFTAAIGLVLRMI